MKYFADAKEAKMIDKISTEDYGISSEILMERAALSAAEFIKRHISPFQRILAISGSGNNGGDASAVARILHEDGYDVSLFMPYYEKVSPLAGRQYDIAGKCGVKLVYAFAPEDFGVVIDGLFGIGLNRDVAGTDYIMIEQMNDSGAKIFSIDIPSGINASTGQVMNIAVKAYATVTFGIMKAGLILSPGCSYAGIVHVARAGFPGKALEGVSKNNFYFDGEDFCPLPERYPWANKGDYGRLLIIAGSYGMSGAAQLCAKAAYRGGCGLVRVLTDEANRAILQEGVPEAIVSCYGGDMDIGEMLKWADAVAIGPGLGHGGTAKELVDTAVRRASAPMVIDADAINILAEEGGYQNVVRNAVITPHLKEMSRLSGKPVEAIKEDMLRFARDNSSKDVVLALKDSRTAVSDGDRTYVNISGNDGMATAGSGDVLTGIIASFLAQGLDRFDAAVAGTYVHGLAGDAAKERVGRYALTASDIIESLGEVLK